MEDTTIVGMIRRGIISKTIRDRSQAVGLKKQTIHGELKQTMGSGDTNV